MKVQSSENKLVNTEEFIFDQNKLPSDPNNHFKFGRQSSSSSSSSINSSSSSNIHKLYRHRPTTTARDVSGGGCGDWGSGDSDIGGRAIWYIAATAAVAAAAALETKFKIVSN